MISNGFKSEAERLSEDGFKEGFLKGVLIGEIRQLERKTAHAQTSVRDFAKKGLAELIILRNKLGPEVPSAVPELLTESKSHITNRPSPPAIQDHPYGLLLKTVHQICNEFYDEGVHDGIGKGILASEIWQLQRHSNPSKTPMEILDLLSIAGVEVRVKNF